MEVFVEQGQSYEKCLRKIYEKYGDNITIIRKKDAKVSKLFGLLEKDIVEVTFTMNTGVRHVASVFSDSVQSRAYQSLDDQEERMKIVKGYANKNPAAAEKLHQFLQNENSVKTNTVQKKNDQHQSVEKLVETVERLVAKVEQQKAPVAPETGHVNIKKIAKILEDNDFSHSYINDICIVLKDELTYTEIEDFQIVQKKLFEILLRNIQIMKPDADKNVRIILLVGPTGVGKTTTLAKLAAHYCVKYEKKGRIITLDRWRIGAVHQIERYCELMNIPLTVASNPTEFRAYMDIYRQEAEVICIDTTGRSPKDKEQLEKMEEYFAILDNTTETYLAVCAGTRINDIREIMKQYNLFHYTSLIITKFDETSYVGNVLSIMAETKIPVTYVTTGQAVPQDFLAATKEVFLSKLRGFSLEEDYIHQLCSKEE